MGTQPGPPPPGQKPPPPPTPATATRELETVDPIEQLAMSLLWDDDYTDEYKRRVLVEAIQFGVSPKGDDGKPK